MIEFNMITYNNWHVRALLPSMYMVTGTYLTTNDYYIYNTKYQGMY